MKNIFIAVILAIFLIACSRYEYNPINPEVLEPPAAPMNLTLVYTTNSFILDWDDNAESDFKEYEIKRTIQYRQTGYSYYLRKGKTIMGITESKYIDTNLIHINSNSYYNYEVYAIDNDDYKSPSSHAYYYFR